VLEELGWEPVLDASKIGVAADHGVVTLTGHVNTFSQLQRAERATKRVSGVEAVANELEIKPPVAQMPDDVSIAQRALSALEWDASVPKGKVNITVSRGWLRLEGDAEWNYQRRAAEDAVRNLFGVRGITNGIVVASPARAAGPATVTHAEWSAPKRDAEDLIAAI
jgi:osmotically-inducible protein OsmY